jgi:hypothetical protein
MKIKYKQKVILSFLILLLITPINVIAYQIESPNYKIVGISTTGGDISQTGSGNYSVLTSLGGISNNPRNYSSSYSIYSSPEHAFLPAVPEVGCFETTSDGTTECLTGLAELTSGGMVALCGTGGCYDRARFEIITNDNPSDTLYAVMISEDNFVSDLRYIDSTTFKPESYSTHNLNDFMSKEDWENETFNIQGLDSNITYHIKIFALKGDFTETEPGPSKDATTASGSVYFDIDIGGENQTDIETSPPYNIYFVGEYELIGGSAPISAGDYIWMDAETNSQGGFAIIVNGKNGGLKSDTTSQIIESVTANLDSVSSGFGIQSSYIAYSTATTFLGSISSMPNYSGSINTVGIVSTSPTKVYDADGPIVDGRMSLKLIARPGIDKIPSTDYEEEIFLVFVPRY